MTLLIGPKLQSGKPGLEERQRKPTGLCGQSTNLLSALIPRQAGLRWGLSARAQGHQASCMGRGRASQPLGQPVGRAPHWMGTVILNLRHNSPARGINHLFTHCACGFPLLPPHCSWGPICGSWNHFSESQAALKRKNGWKGMGQSGASGT